MKKKKKTSPTPFYLSFDELFEKPKLKNIGSRKLSEMNVEEIELVEKLNQMKRLNELYNGSNF